MGEIKVVGRRTAAATSVGLLVTVALLGAGPAAAKTKTLYSQLGSLNPSFAGINTQSYETDVSSYDDQAADDFSVPKQKSWKVTQVDFDAGYTVLGGSNAGPSRSFNVFFYKDDNDLPGKGVDTQKSLHFRIRGTRTLVVKLKNAVHLRAGHYWVSVQANQDASTSGQFFWLGRKNNDRQPPAMWENPGDGFGSGCTDWTVVTSCTTSTLSSLSFDLKGTVKKHPAKARATGYRVHRAHRAVRSASSAQAASPLSPSAAGTSSPLGVSG
jgi:hypothetical protein